MSNTPSDLKWEPICKQFAEDILDLKGVETDEFWCSVSEMQIEGAVALYNRLAKRRITWLCDEVGLGKTYVALAVATLLRVKNPNARILYLLPSSRLISKWQRDLKKFCRENIKHTDHNARTIQGEPHRPLVVTNGIFDLAFEYKWEPERDFLCTLDAFSFALQDEKFSEDIEPEDVLKNWSAGEREWNRLANLFLNASKDGQTSSMLPKWDVVKDELCTSVTKKLKKELKENDILNPETLFSEIKKYFKWIYAELLNLLLPDFDLVICDESHNLKSGITGMSSRNQLISRSLGGVFARENESGAETKSALEAFVPKILQQLKEFMPVEQQQRSKRVLCLTATPFSHSYREIVGQATVFGFYPKKESSQENTEHSLQAIINELHKLATSETKNRTVDEELKSIVKKYVIRRLGFMQFGEKKFTRNEYRREYRHGSMDNENEKMALSSCEQLILGLVQKRVLDALGDTNPGIPVGLLSSFEAFQQDVDTKAAKQTKELEFDDLDKPESGDKTTIEKEQRAISHLVESFSDKFKDLNVKLPHPKLDITAEAIAKAVRNGEKTLVFVRRVFTTTALRQRINDFIDQFLNEHICSQMNMLGFSETQKNKWSEKWKEFLLVKANRSDSTVKEDNQQEQGSQNKSDKGKDEKKSKDTLFRWFFRGKIDGLFKKNNHELLKENYILTLFNNDEDKIAECFNNPQVWKCVRILQKWKSKNGKDIKDPQVIESYQRAALSLLHIPSLQNQYLGVDASWGKVLLQIDNFHKKPETRTKIPSKFRRFYSNSQEDIEKYAKDNCLPYKGTSENRNVFFKEYSLQLNTWLQDDGRKHCIGELMLAMAFPNRQLSDCKWIDNYQCAVLNLLAIERPSEDQIHIPHSAVEDVISTCEPYSMAGRCEDFKCLTEPNLWSEMSKQEDRRQLLEEIWNTGTQIQKDKIREREFRKQMMISSLNTGWSCVDLWLSLIATQDTSITDCDTRGNYKVWLETFTEKFCLILKYHKDSYRKPDSNSDNYFQYNAYTELTEIQKNYSRIVTTNFSDLHDGSIEDSKTKIITTLSEQNQVVAVHGNNKDEKLQKQFRMPGMPFVIVSTSVLKEGVDLHTFCRRVVHYGMEGSSTGTEQRNGRVDRYGSLNQRLNEPYQTEHPAPKEFIKIFFPHLQGTIESIQMHRLYRNMNRFLLMSNNLDEGYERVLKLNISQENKEDYEDYPPLYTEHLESSFGVSQEDKSDYTDSGYIKSDEVKEIDVRLRDASWVPKDWCVNRIEMGANHETYRWNNNAFSFEIRSGYFFRRQNDPSLLCRLNYSHKRIPERKSQHKDPQINKNNNKEKILSVDFFEPIFSDDGKINLINPLGCQWIVSKENSNYHIHLRSERSFPVRDTTQNLEKWQNIISDFSQVPTKFLLRERQAEEKLKPQRTENLDNSNKLIQMIDKMDKFENDESSPRFKIEDSNRAQNLILEKFKVNEEHTIYRLKSLAIKINDVITLLQKNTNSSTEQAETPLQNNRRRRQVDIKNGKSYITLLGWLNLMTHNNEIHGASIMLDTDGVYVYQYLLEDECENEPYVQNVIYNILHVGDGLEQRFTKTDRL